MFEKSTTLLKPMLTITMPVLPVLWVTFTLIPMLLLLSQAVVTKPNFTKHVSESYFTKTGQP